jgi:hypothetical protein
VLFLAIAALWPGSEATADHSAAPRQRRLVPGLPLTYCRPLHLSSEPSEFRPGESARRFLIFVDRQCAGRSEPVEVEVWYRAPYRDPEGRLELGTPYLVGFVQTRTDLTQLTSRVASGLPYFDVPGKGFALYPGCYLGRIRITAAPEDPSAKEHIGEIERCATAPRPSLPGPN